MPTGNDKYLAVTRENLTWASSGKMRLHYVTISYRSCHSVETQQHGLKQLLLQLMLHTKLGFVELHCVSFLAAVIAGVIGFLLFVIVIILLFLCKPVWKKDEEGFNPKVDANANCESGDEINQGYLRQTQLNYITVPSPEQQCLLQRGEACSDHSQCSNNTETLTRTDGSSSQESIGPLQSTMTLHNPHSALSEPMTLHSNTETVPPQPSIPTQSSSQPTSPQVISPVTTSPHVNVNITFHIENRSCGTPSVTPTDSMQVDSKLPFGEEEESFSIPHQEAGKQSLMSVQESESCSAPA